MARPWRCNSLDDYLDWIADAVEQSGGYLPDDILNVEDLVVEEGGDVVGAIIPKQMLQFYDGTRLWFDQQVTTNCEVDEYHYAYMFDDGTGICRLDKHPGHEQVAGGLEHLHVGQTREEEVVYPADHYDFDDAVEFVRNYARDPLGLLP